MSDGKEKTAGTAAVVEDQPLIPLPHGKRNLFFIILYALFAIDFVARIGVNAIYPLIQQDLQLNDAQLGIVTGIVQFGMGVFVLPIAFLGERYSTKWAIAVSAVIWGLGSLVSGVATGFASLAASRFAVGVGNAAYAPLSVAMLTSWYKKKHAGRIIGLYNTAMKLGQASGSVIFAYCAVAYGWRSAFYIVGVVSILLAGASLLLPDFQKDRQKSASFSSKQITVMDTVRAVFGNKVLLLVCLGGGIAVLVVTAMTGWYAIYFTRIMKVSIQYSAWIISSISVLGMLFYPIGGYILDKLYPRDKRSRVLFPAFIFALTAVLYWIGFTYQLVLVIGFAGGVYTSGIVAFHATTQEIVPASYKAIAYGAYVICIQLLGALGPIITGFLSQSFGIAKALQIIPLFFIIPILMFLYASKYYVEYFNRARAAELEE